MLKAVLFDLDGTLLPLDTDAFAADYFRRLAREMAPLIPPAQLADSIMASTMAMIGNTDPALSNAEVFWANFLRRVDHPRSVLEPAFERFYAETFPLLCPPGAATPHARAAVDAALAAGCQVVLATNALFPEPAIRERMRWAGVHEYPWQLVTSLENMHACKPQPHYYREVLDRLGLRPEECLMVGNDVEEDGVAARLGMGFYLVTDYLINRSGATLPEPRGVLAEFPGWLQRNAI